MRFLTDLYLSIKEKIFHLYHNADIAFPSNAEIIEFINEKYYLYEIVLFFTEQFEMIIRAIGNPSSESVMDDIIHYIEHNYMDNIKLENIAPLFGYNSSYLGKIFTKKVGEGFNVFVDKIRIEHSKELLINSSMKVYEIAEKVGYSLDQRAETVVVFIKSQIINKNNKFEGIVCQHLNQLG